MELQPKVSVITVTYNCIKALQRTIDSVIGQSYGNVEYILVDGCSTDGTLELIKSNAAKYPDIIRYISEKDNGLYDAMNKGIALATGEIIGIINGDDYYRQDTLITAVNLLSDNIEIVYSDLVYTRNGVEDWEHPLLADHRRLIERMSVNHPTCFVKKTVYEKYGVFDTELRIAADYEIMARFYSKGCLFTKSNAVLAVMEAGGLSNNNWKSIHEKYIVHRRYFSRLNAELYRIRNVFLYLYRKARKR